MFLWPVPGYYTITSGYDDMRDYGLHGAIDIAAPAVPAIAIGAGRIIFANWAGSAGRSVYLELEGGYRVHYCHLSAFNVTAGQTVAARDVIGLVGGSGYGVDNYYGSHLHLNLFTSERPATGPSHWVAWVGMWAVDPALYLGQEDTVAGPTQQEIIENLWARMAAAERWFGAHNTAHMNIYDPNIRQLNDRVKNLEAEVAARPTGSGVTEAQVMALILQARHTI